MHASFLRVVAKYLETQTKAVRNSGFDLHKLFPGGPVLAPRSAFEAHPHVVQDALVQLLHAMSTHASVRLFSHGKKDRGSVFHSVLLLFATTPSASLRGLTRRVILSLAARLGIFGGASVVAAAGATDSHHAPPTQDIGLDEASAWLDALIGADAAVTVAELRPAEAKAPGAITAHIRFMENVVAHMSSSGASTQALSSVEAAAGAGAGAGAGTGKNEAEKPVSALVLDVALGALVAAARAAAAAAVTVTAPSDDAPPSASAAAASALFGPAKHVQPATLPGLAVFVSAVARRLLLACPNPAALVATIARVTSQADGTAVAPALRRLHGFATRAFGSLVLRTTPLTTQLRRRGAAPHVVGGAPSDGGVARLRKLLQGAVSKKASGGGVAIVDRARRGRVALRLTRCLQAVTVGDMSAAPGLFAAACVACRVVLADMSPIISWLSAPAGAAMYNLGEVWSALPLVLSGGEVSRSGDSLPVDAATAFVSTHPVASFLPAAVAAQCEGSSGAQLVLGAVVHALNGVSFAQHVSHACAYVVRCVAFRVGFHSVLCAGRYG